MIRESEGDRLRYQSMERMQSSWIMHALDVPWFDPLRRSDFDTLAQRRAQDVAYVCYVTPNQGGLRDPDDE